MLQEWESLKTTQHHQVFFRPLAPSSRKSYKKRAKKLKVQQIKMKSNKVVVEHCMSTCLFSSSPATSLVWRFKSNAAAAVSDFDMKSVKVTTSSIYVSAQLPSYGVVRTPMHVRYELTNRTDKVQEFSCLMQPSEAFMFSGNKQHNMKVHQRPNYPFQNTTQLKKVNIFQINFTHPTIDPTHL